MLNFSCKHYAFKPALLGALVLLAVSGAPGARAAGSDILFVLDGSGSMWGQIDGVAKIETARETLSRLLNDVPGESRLGLMTYGATSKTSCEDVAVLNAIGSDRGAIQKSIAGLKPLGKTPIQASLAQGIELLASAEPTDTRKSLVLISDGIETCGGDPCAMARSAAASGVDMKLHVVGFDVDAEARAQLQCIAEGGGGQYFNASDTAGFATAMRAVAEVAAEPEPEPEPEPVNQRVFFDDFEGDALAEGDWVVNNRDSSGYIVEDSKLVVVQSGGGWSKNWFELRRSIPDGAWDAVIRFNAKFNTGNDFLIFTLLNAGDGKNYLAGRIDIKSDRYCTPKQILLDNFMSINGEETNFTTTIFETSNCNVYPDRKKQAENWLNSFAKSDKPYEFGLHKRGRNYHVSLGWDSEDGKKPQYKT